MAIKEAYTIIIPTLNEGKYLKKLLTHLNALGLNAKVLISDGGSSDNTLQIAQEHTIETLHSKKAQRAHQLNQAAKHANTKYLFFLHVDSILPNNFESLLTKAIQENIKTASFRLQFDWPHWFLKLNAWFTRFNLVFFRYGDQGLFVQRNTFFLAGGYDENLSLLEDQEIIWRLKQLGTFKVFNAYIITSARKYRKYGAYRLQRLFVKLTVMYYLGASQKTLMCWYQKVLAKPLKKHNEDA